MITTEDYKISEVNSYGTLFTDIKDLPQCDALDVKIRHYGYTNLFSDCWGGKMDRYLSIVEYKKFIIYIKRYEDRKDYCLQDYSNNVYYVKTRKDAIRLAKSLVKCHELGIEIKPSNYKTQMVFEYELPNYLSYKYKSKGYGHKYRFMLDR